MKAMMIKAVLGVAVLSMSQLGVAQTKTFAGDVSDGTYIAVGKSGGPWGPHQPNLAGIGVEAGGMSKSQIVDIGFLASVGSTVGIAKVLNMAGTSPVPDHTGLGVFSFVQVGGSDVWFGEFSSQGAPNFDARSVFYIGENTDVSMPTSGEAIYAVNGLNHFAVASDALSVPAGGQFKADFGAGTVIGSIENSSLGISVDASIAGSSFTGTAEAYNPATSATLDANGVSKGEFYGADAAFLAGMATFVNNSQYDTSFGGERGAITP
ncbi:hypothetical protein A6D6_01149 [Alcanivorax xiamenensis]|uniref:Transferrin-binding protein B C-lobe/N-lobe beta barrel domain-containing protein n=1 Tax=Alcanivorax xiamenensis TaxID=1177156 RepID=A0ABQ6YB43_9GAMM|nr:Slam-dependent surface lipoprotein [Alcanivorax xiamenensis]KAF0807150.1 hypothetical protein A6D6_01149 [Alcanivorax xiamenensis]